MAVHNYDQDKAASDIAHIKGERKLEIARAASDIARIEGGRKLAEQFWKGEVEGYKYDIQLAHADDYKPYQTAISEREKYKKREKKRGEKPEDRRKKMRRTSFWGPA